ncbi:hypothetical protein VTO73DRAFT_14081 [Trametes versicolor]
MGKNRKSKVYVDNKDAAVELAKSIADVQEKKTRARVEVRKSKAVVAPKKPTEKHTTSSKEKLDRAKAAVAAQAAHAKREKAKIRKKARVSVPDGSATGAHSGAGETPAKPSGTSTRKRVTFG